MVGTATFNENKAIIPLSTPFIKICFWCDWRLLGAVRSHRRPPTEGPRTRSSSCAPKQTSSARLWVGSATDVPRTPSALSGASLCDIPWPYWEHRPPCAGCVQRARVILCLATLRPVPYATAAGCWRFLRLLTLRQDSRFPARSHGVALQRNLAVRYKDAIAGDLSAVPWGLAAPQCLARQAPHSASC